MVTNTDTSIHILIHMKQSDFMIDYTLDYHAHILPGCDHGSDCLKTSLEQIEMARKAGIKTICATPHFYPHKETVEEFSVRRQHAFDEMLPGLTEDSPCILLGAEVLICDGMEHLDGLQSLCLQGTNELLLEMPFYNWPDSLWDTLYQLQDMDDIKIVIAHADRYPAENIEYLIRDGFILQLNAECFLKAFHRKRYISWLNSGRVKYLGSDIHMLGNGYRNFERCKKTIGSKV